MRHFGGNGHAGVGAIAQALAVACTIRDVGGDGPAEHIACKKHGWVFRVIHGKSERKARFEPGVGFVRRLNPAVEWRGWFAGRDYRLCKAWMCSMCRNPLLRRCPLPRHRSHADHPANPPKHSDRPRHPRLHNRRRIRRPGHHSNPVNLFSKNFHQHYQSLKPLCPVPSPRPLLAR
jgi:hypothetical protein